LSPQPATHAAQTPRRILVRGVNWLGDAIMTTPALTRLRETFPGAHISLLTPAKLAELWLHHPAINETISFAPGEGLSAVCRKLRAGNFDLALVLPNSPRSALEAWLGRVPRRVGYARAWRNFFLTTAVPRRSGVVTMHKRSISEIKRLIQSPAAVGEPKALPGDIHQVFDYLHLVASLGGNPELAPLQLSVADNETAAVRKKFELAKIQEPILGLNPGAEYGPAKRWPADRFAAVASEIQKRTGGTWLIFGGKGDVELASRIETATGIPQSTIRNLAGRTSLRELMALLKSCRVLLTNDTGPMHVAAALGTPVVVPFGSTSPELTGPGLPGETVHRLIKSTAPCSPCFLRECPIDFRCMTGIETDIVVAAIVKALNNRGDAETRRTGI
jgi:heptosyltransferase-2